MALSFILVIRPITEARIADKVKEIFSEERMHVFLDAEGDKSTILLPVKSLNSIKI